MNNNIFPNKSLMVMITLVSLVYSVINLLLNIDQWYKMLFYGAGAITICISLLIAITCDTLFTISHGQDRRDVGNMGLIAFALLLVGGAMVAIAEFLL